MNTAMLTPMLALVAWTAIIWIWMYATRIPAMQRAGLDASKIQRKSDLDVLPIEVQRIADNYNHLHEQPVIFYALVTYCYLTGNADGLNIGLAWAYVGLRILHSLIQCTFNFIPARFGVFAAGSIVLFVITARCLLAL